MSRAIASGSFPLPNSLAGLLHVLRLDQTTGANGTVADVSAHGGITAIRCDRHHNDHHQPGQRCTRSQR